MEHYVSHTKYYSSCMKCIYSFQIMYIFIVKVNFLWTHIVGFHFFIQSAIYNLRPLIVFRSVAFNAVITMIVLKSTIKDIIRK